MNYTDTNNIIYSYLPFEQGIQYGYTKNYDPKIHTPLWAIVSSFDDCVNRLIIIKWLHKTTNEGWTYTINWAAHNGHLDIVIWFHENRTEGCSYQAIDLAASNGHLDVVKWLHENTEEGCSYDAMKWAAENGHIEVVKFLHENYKEDIYDNTDVIEAYFEWTTGYIAIDTSIRQLNVSGNIISHPVRSWERTGNQCMGYLYSNEVRGSAS